MTISLRQPNPRRHNQCLKALPLYVSGNCPVVTSSGYVDVLTSRFVSPLSLFCLSFVSLLSVSRFPDNCHRWLHRKGIGSDDKKLWFEWFFFHCQLWKGQNNCYHVSKSCYLFTEVFRSQDKKTRVGLSVMWLASFVDSPTEQNILLRMATIHDLVPWGPRSHHASKVTTLFLLNAKVGVERMRTINRPLGGNENVKAERKKREWNKWKR